MKVGTVSKVMLGGNADVSTKSGIIIDADVILGKAEGRTKDLKGLVLSNKLMFGKSISRAKMATVSGVAPLVLADAISADVVSLIAFGGTEQRNIPKEYTQLGGLVFDGSSYVDTGLTSFSNDGVYECDFVTSTLGTTFLFGQNPSASASQVGFFTSASLVWQYGASSRLTASNTANTAYNIVTENGKLTINGTATTGTASETITINQHLFVGAGVTPSANPDSNNPDARMFAGTIKRFKYTLAGVVMCDLVPAKRNSDNVLGFYDTVSETFLTNAGTGAFTSAGAVAPTPDAPIDIVCNNGVLKYSPNLLNPDNIEVGYYRVSGTGVLTPSPYNWAYMGYIPVTPGTKYMFYGRRRSDNHLSAYNRIHWYNADKEFISTNSYTVNTIGTGTAPSNAAYACMSCNESGGTTATTTDAVVAAYDWVFEAGTSEAPYIPYSATNPYTTGPIETIGIKDSNNLLPADAQPDVLYPVTVTGAGNWTASANVNNGQNLAACEIRYYNENKQQINYYTINGYSDGRMYKTFSVTTAVKYVSISRKAAYATTPVTELKVETGNTMTPYFNGGTATAEMLLKVGNYQDQQEIIGGTVTRNVGVTIFDGTEEWGQNATGKFRYDNNYMLNYNNTPVLCTHYEGVLAASTSGVGYGQVGLFASGTQGASPARLVVGDNNYNTTDGFKAFLAAQYAAGTPVILVYPLATATTESVTGQPMTTTQGTNIAEITQASLDGLELSVTYMAGVDATVEEIENAQLSPDVDVTIS